MHVHVTIRLIAFLASENSGRQERLTRKSLLWKHQGRNYDKAPVSLCTHCQPSTLGRVRHGRRIYGLCADTKRLLCATINTRQERKANNAYASLSFVRGAFFSRMNNLLVHVSPSNGEIYGGGVVMILRTPFSQGRHNMPWEMLTFCIISILHNITNKPCAHFGFLILYPKYIAGLWLTELFIFWLYACLAHATVLTRPSLGLYLRRL